MCSGRSLKRAPRILLEHTMYNTRPCQLANKLRRKTWLCPFTISLQAFCSCSKSPQPPLHNFRTAAKPNKTCVPFQTGSSSLSQKPLQHNLHTHSRSRLLASMLTYFSLSHILKGRPAEDRAMLLQHKEEQRLGKSTK